MGKIKSLLIIFSIFLLTGCVYDKDTTVTLALDWTPNTNHTGFVVALEKGYYEQFGINLEIIQPPEDGSIPLVATNKAHFGITAQEELATALDNTDAPIIAVATILKHNTSGILSLKEKGITRFEDLENKTYATWGLPFEQAILKQVMQDRGGNFSKVNLFYSSATDAISALEKYVDAVWVYEGWDVIKAKLLGIDYNFIKFKDTNPILDFYTPIIISNEKFLQKNQELARKFMLATKMGYEYAIKNPQESAEILVKYYPEIDLELAIESQKYLSNEYTSENEEWGIINPERWNSFFKWAFEKGLITQNLENKGFTNEFLSNLESVED